jgi:hypothetical protein
LRKVPHSLRESSHYRFSDKDEALLLCLFSDSFERAGVIPIPVEYRSKKPVKKAVFTSCRFEATEVREPDLVITNVLLWIRVISSSNHFINHPVKAFAKSALSIVRFFLPLKIAELIIASCLRL